MIKRDIRVQIVIIENGQYILLKHHNKKKNEYFWGLPGGGREIGETIEDAAIREAKEETNLEIQLLPFKYEVFLENSEYYDKKATFIGFPLSGVAKTGYEPEADLSLLFELVDIKWHPLNDILNIDDFTKGDILPVKTFLENNHFIKRAGALVYKIENSKIKFLFISGNLDRNIFVIPQGHVENNESYQDAAVRETIEEAGVHVEIKKELGFFFFEKKHQIHQTYIFLAKYLNEEKMLENRIVKWLSYDEAKSLFLYKETRRFFEELIKEDLI